MIVCLEPRAQVRAWRFIIAAFRGRGRAGCSTREACPSRAQGKSLHQPEAFRLRIDAHHHFWKYDPQEYAWIDEPMKAIRRDFLPEHLEREIRAAGIGGVISVQARQTMQETRWLLDLAAEHKFIQGVVGWVPLTSRDLPVALEELSAKPKLRAVRHILQSEPDDDYMLRDDFNAGIAELRRFGLVYDILIFERHLPQTLRFVDRHPGQVFVLDHIAKPRIKDGALSPWRENMAELAKRENVYCKVSGMVTEADYRAWTEEQLIPYLEVVASAFGPRRLMFGSDWPVCLVACGYGRWHEIASRFFAGFTTAEQEWVFGGTAAEAYGINTA